MSSDLQQKIAPSLSNYRQKIEIKSLKKMRFSTNFRLDRRLCKNVKTNFKLTHPHDLPPLI